MNNNQNRCGCGGQPTVMDIDRETKENTNFRKEAWTGEHLQVTLMCIPTNCDIGAEIHEDTDQLVCIVQGCATISFGATKCSMCDGQRANGRIVEEVEIKKIIWKFQNAGWGFCVLRGW